jgi:hypothetical protein
MNWFKQKELEIKQEIKKACEIPFIEFSNNKYLKFLKKIEKIKKKYYKNFNRG